jgi:hypothetical protein
LKVPLSHPVNTIVMKQAIPPASGVGSVCTLCGALFGRSNSPTLRARSRLIQDTRHTVSRAMRIASNMNEIEVPIIYHRFGPAYFSLRKKLTANARPSLMNINK